MIISAKVLTKGFLVVLCVAFAFKEASAFDKADLDRKLSAIVSYEHGMDRQPLIVVEELIRQSQNQPEQRKYIELRLAEILADATFEGKSFICKQLWLIGTVDSVPAIAKLLEDEKTADMACYAISQNPSQEAGKALRDALDKTSTNVQIRIINLLGDRRDTQSVEALGKLVFDTERQVAEAATGALGKIGGLRAREILVKARAEGDSELRFAATDAYLRCAENLVAQDQTEPAIEIYRELAGQDEAAIIRSAAIKGLADIGGREAVPIVIAAIQDEDRIVRTTARGCIRTMQGQGITDLFAAELEKTSGYEQVLLIAALADRGDPNALPTIIKRVRSNDPEVGKAALQAIGRLGDASCVGILVEVAAESLDSEQKKVALNSLSLLRGRGVDDAIVKSMQNARPSVRPELIQVLLDRNAVDSVPALLAEASNPDSKISRAAFKALGRLASEKDLPLLVGLLVNLQDDSSRREAERATIAASRKISDENKRSDAILAVLNTEKRVPVRCSLLRVLGGIANSRALEALTAASKEAEPDIRDTAIRALAKWPNASAAQVLLEIYSDTKNPVYRMLSLRGFVRLLALPAGSLPLSKTLEMCRKAVSQVRGIEEKKLVLSGLSNVIAPETLTIVESFLQTEGIKTEAAMAAIKIAREMIETHPDKVKIAMNKLLSFSQDEALGKQAREIIRQVEEFEKNE